MRPTSRRLRRRKAVSEASLPGSGHSSSSADDPMRTIKVLENGRLTRRRSERWKPYRSRTRALQLLEDLANNATQ